VATLLAISWLLWRQAAEWLLGPVACHLVCVGNVSLLLPLHAGAIVGSRRPRPFLQVHPVGGGVAWLAALRSAGLVARNITIGLLDLLLG
jgi:hypothetical protein